MAGLPPLQTARLGNRVVLEGLPPLQTARLGNRVEYRLTPAGETLRPLILQIREWGTLYLDRVLEHRAAALAREEQACVAAPQG